MMAGNRHKNEIAPVPFLPESHSLLTPSALLRSCRNYGCGVPTYYIA